MELKIKDELYNDILSFCKVNSIDNVEEFSLACLLKGYNIVKYGLSPKDNVKKESEPVSVMNDIEQKEKVERKGKKVKILKN